MAVAEPGVQSVGQTGKPAVQPGPTERVGDFRIGGARPGEPHVLDEGGSEHVWLVVHQPGEPAYVVECKPAEILASVPQLTRSGIEEPDQQCGERALARARSADQRDALARVQPQRALRGCGAVVIPPTADPVGSHLVPTGRDLADGVADGGGGPGQPAESGRGSIGPHRERTGVGEGRGHLDQGQRHQE